MKIISANERDAEPRGVTILITGPVGVGKTSLLHTLDQGDTLFIDVERGGLSVQDLLIDTIRPDGGWTFLRDFACRFAGPDPSYPPNSCYSQAHYESIGHALEGVDRYRTIFVDSLSSVSRLALRWAEQQPEATNARGVKDLRGAYGLLAREMMALLNQLQRARGKNIIFITVLEKAVDEFNYPEWRPQLEGSKTGRELPAIVDEIITMQWIDFGDGELVRAFVCTSPNRWGYPAKDRSGRLEQIEEPHLGKLVSKLTDKVHPEREAQN